MLFLEMRDNIPCGSEPEKHQTLALIPPPIPIEEYSTYMINNLVRYATVVLEDIEVLGASDLGDLLCDGLFDLRDLLLVSVRSCG